MGKVIEELDVTVSFTVSLAKVDMPKDVYKQLKLACDNGDTIYEEDIHSKIASDWIKRNINIADRYDWKTDIHIIE